MKTCRICHEEKTLDLFGNNKSYADGKSSECKACEKKRKAEYYKQKGEDIRAKNKLWHENNRNRAILVQKEWRQKNLKKDQENKRKYRKNNIERVRANQKRYAGKYKEKAKSYNKQFRLDNPEKMMFRSAFSRSRRIGVPFDISLDDIEMPTHCPILGIELKLSETGLPAENSPSIDRIIPELGYVKGNIFVVSHRANAIKRDATLEELKSLLAWMEPRVEAVKKQYFY